MAEFQPYIAHDHDQATRSILKQLPQPIEIKKLSDGNWCIRLQLTEHPIAAIGKSPSACGERMLCMLKLRGKTP